MLLTVFWVSALLCLVGNAFAAGEEEGNEGFFADVLERLGADGEYDPDKIIDFSFLPGPFYSPDKEFGLALVAVGAYQPGAYDPTTQLSSLVITSLASTNGSYGLEVSNKTFLNSDRQRLYLDVEIANEARDYYGIGYDQNRIGGNQTSIDNQLFKVTPMFMQRVARDTYLGFGYDFNYQKAKGVEDSEADLDLSELMSSGTSSGLTVLLSHDSRDMVTNAHSGRLIQLEGSLYRKDLGSDSNFEVVRAEYSDYQRVGRGDDVIAWQALGRFTMGDVPWYQLSTAGGADYLRAYQQSRYRDKHFVMAQAEYRYNPAGRHGLVAWAGAGAIAPSIDEFHADEILPTAGIGYRFEVKPRMNLRLDMGFGDGESGVYFNINEAF